MNNLSAQECLIRGIALIRSNQASEAVPFLEVAVNAGVGRFSRDILETAKAFAQGVEAVDVRFGERTFKFALVPGNLGMDIHHVAGRFFEADELAFCTRVVPTRAVVVDVGANTGNNVIFYAGFLKPSLVIPVEPVAETVVILRRNLQLNGLSVDERGLGVAAAAEKTELLGDNAGEDMTVFSVRRKHEGEEGAVIRGVPLDELIPERIDFLKIDVEGFEGEALKGARRILSEDKPLLCLEVTDQNRDAIAIIAEYGYRPFKEFQAIGYKNVFFRVSG
jgi:FkbM family methyltransferase